MRLRWIIPIFLLSAVFFLPSPVVVPVRASTYQPHQQIVIDGNSGFNSTNGVTGGRGTPLDPYIISGWDINAAYPVPGIVVNGGAGIVERHTTVPFIIRNVNVHSGKLEGGISLSRVTGGVVENSVVSQCDPGIVADASSNVIFEGNTVHGDLAYGIYLYYSNNSSVKDNTVYSAGVSGIFLFGANWATVTNNTAYQDQVGIQVLESNYNTISANNFSSNSLNGIRLYQSTHNLLYHNNLIGNGLQTWNGVQAWDNPTGAPPSKGYVSTNQWDDGYPIGGNYYSDYSWPDNCSGPVQSICPYPDGITDVGAGIEATRSNSSSYIIFTVSSDHYPLVAPFSAKPSGQDFTLNFNPSSLTLLDGTSGAATVSLTSIGLFRGFVLIAASVSPSGPTLLLDTSNVTVYPGMQGHPTLTFTPDTSWSAGSYTVSIDATEGSIIRQVKLNVELARTQVQPYPATGELALAFGYQARDPFASYPGGSVILGIGVQNVGTVPVKIVAINVSTDFSGPLPSPATTPFLLSAGERRDFSMTVQIPAGTSVGGHGATVTIGYDYLDSSTQQWIVGTSGPMESQAPIPVYESPSQTFGTAFIILGGILALSSSIPLVSWRRKISFSFVGRGLGLVGGTFGLLISPFALLTSGPTPPLATYFSLTLLIAAVAGLIGGLLPRISHVVAGGVMLGTALSTFPLWWYADWIPQAMSVYDMGAQALNTFGTFFFWWIALLIVGSLMMIIDKTPVKRTTPQESDLSLQEKS